MRSFFGAAPSRSSASGRAPTCRSAARPSRRAAADRAGRRVAAGTAGSRRRRHQHRWFRRQQHVRRRLRQPAVPAGQLHARRLHADEPARTAARRRSAASSTTRPARRRSTTSSSTCPNEPLADITTGASCDTCSSPYSGRPIAAALTDSTGHFSVEHVPVGDNIPLVIQIGKWRRAVTIPSVAACADTPVDASLTHLPRNRSEGHIPRIAIANGGSDALNCLLKKIGVDTARVHVRVGRRARQPVRRPERADHERGRHDVDRHVDAVEQRRGHEGVRHHAAVVRGQRQQRRGRGADGDAAGGEGLRRRGRPRVRIALAQRLGVRRAGAVADRREARVGRARIRPATSRCRS